MAVHGSEPNSLGVGGTGLTRGPNGAIAFLHGNQVAVMNDDGGNVRALARANQGSEDPVAPSWSPDGRLLAVGNGSGCDPYSDCASWSIRIIDVKTGKWRSVIRWAKEPSWSPDGREIAFEGGSVPGDRRAKVPFEVTMARPDGTGRRPVADGALPAWSPTGKLVAFFAISPRDIFLGLHVMRPNGNNQRLVGNSEAVFAWSPDGSQIAFIGPFGPDRIAVYSVATGRIRRVGPSDLSHAGGIAWSPDGSMLAWVSYHYARNADQLFIARSSGLSKPVVLVRTRSGQRIWTPVFTGDGRRILYSLFQFH